MNHDKNFISNLNDYDIFIAFVHHTDEKKLVEIFLPARKMYLNKLSAYKNKLLGLNFKYSKIKTSDYKFFGPKMYINTFEIIIRLF